ncbi:MULTISPECIES: hypothetical protein [Pantoea]|jgi:hypothetical protein|uniref:hypothetical protein n=1 Tax=Pantoea TaxID=53335 RepID=UPI0006A25529|nr:MULTISPECIES: hypothetical protein [Pantoea]KNA27280.1 hypothetical protein ACO03_17510 [Pantoea ananatis]MDC7872107.1 hypothetical protein [Pantoea ananatis]WRH11907.1 hypothetical protein GC087_04370 [Pantoea sp. JZ2]
MKNQHEQIVKELTDEVDLLLVAGGQGSGDWGTGAQAVWGTAVSAISGRNCSWPGGFYSTRLPGGGIMCVPMGGGRARTARMQGGHLIWE